jgi:hypothetical protein
MHNTLIPLAVQTSATLDALIPMVVCTVMFAMIFGIVYLKSRENMALIERGMNPKQQIGRPKLYSNLKWGLLLIGSGVGLILAFILDRSLPEKSGTHTEKRIVKKITTDKGDTVMMTDSGKDMNGAAKGTQVKIKPGTDGGAASDEETLTDGIENHEKGGEEVVINMGGSEKSDNTALYFALIAVGGGLGLFLSYRIERKDAENLKKKTGIDLHSAD